MAPALSLYIWQLRSFEALLVGSRRYLVVGRLVVRLRTLVMRVWRRSGDVVNSLLTLASTVVLSMLWL